MRLFNKKQPVEANPQEKLAESSTPTPLESSPHGTPLGTTARNTTEVPRTNEKVVQEPVKGKKWYSFGAEKDTERGDKGAPATTKAILLGAIASIGGFMFGYESGQISGKFAPKNIQLFH